MNEKTDTLYIYEYITRGWKKLQSTTLSTCRYTIIYTHISKLLFQFDIFHLIDSSCEKQKRLPK